MKSIARMIIFSAVALYFTSLWNSGFSPSYDWKSFLLASVIVTILFYLINPLAKMIFLPINILTMGLISVFVYIFLFHFLLNYFSLIEIKTWTFQGVTINYWLNLCLSALSVSTIINLLEKLL